MNGYGDPLLPDFAGAAHGRSHSTLNVYNIDGIVLVQVGSQIEWRQPENHVDEQYDVP